MNAKLAVQAVMTTFPHSIGVEQNLQTARDMMHAYSVRHLPVQESGKLVGVLSEGDINFAIAVEKKSAAEMTVAEAFTEEPYMVDGSEDVKRVARRMYEDRIGCTLVVQGESVVGIFTTTDACRTLAEVLSNSIGAAAEA